MKTLGGSIVLAAGLLGLFAPYLDGLFALGGDAKWAAFLLSPFPLLIGAAFALVVLGLAIAILNKRSRVLSLLVIAVAFLATFATFGSLTHGLFYAAIAGGALSLFGNHRTGRSASIYDLA